MKNIDGSFKEILREAILKYLSGKENTCLKNKSARDTLTNDILNIVKDELKKISEDLKEESPIKKEIINFLFPSPKNKIKK